MVPEVPKIKFCGVTSVEDAQRAVAAGAWAVGLIFWPHSPRRCELQAAAEIGEAFKRRVELAGVFVNPTLEELAGTAEAAGLTMVQLHGDEGPAFCSEAARRTGCRVIKAVRVRGRADIQALSVFHTDFHLLDSYVPGMLGGTGETFAWETARAHGTALPPARAHGTTPPPARAHGTTPPPTRAPRGPVPMILSGGLTPANVAEAIATVRPYAVDVASGVEPDGGPPTRKDPSKLEAFAAAVASTAASALSTTG